MSVRRVVPGLVAFGGLAVVLGGCLGSPRLPSSGKGGGCAALGGAACKDADGLLAAMGSYSNVSHDFLLDATGSYAPGRGVVKSPSGTRLLTEACAVPKASQAEVERATIDYAYVGLAVDDVVVSAEADLVPFLAAGAAGATHTVKLVAVAFVRDKDPQFFSPSPAMTYESEKCACAGATDFIGSVKMGGLLAYEITVRHGEVTGKALELVKAKLRAEDASVKQTVVGGLEVENLDEAISKGSHGKPLTFKVKNPVPVAYALYPLADVCRFTLPEPDISPQKIDLGDVPYGREATRLVRVVNRSSLELRALVQGGTFAVPALGTAEVPIVVKPRGDEPACDTVTREEVIVFQPRDEAPVTPKSHTMKVEVTYRSGAPEVTRTARIDSGASHTQDWLLAKGDVTCPTDYVAEACGTSNEEGCEKAEARIEATSAGGVCHFVPKARTSILPTLRSQRCAYQANATCRLKCK
ncbi:MAG: hypothetical protein U0183_20030 [Polyangiaceae bacterium]